MAVMAATEVAMERMGLEKGGNGGLIINTASLAGIAKGFGSDSASYFVAKHGVVTLTRTLGVWCLYFEFSWEIFNVVSKTLWVRRMESSTCAFVPPSLILLSLKMLECRGRLLKNELALWRTSCHGLYSRKNNDLFRPEFVADCFLKLVKTGRNGEAMVVMKNIPPFIYGDHSMQLITVLAIGAKLTEKVDILIKSAYNPEIRHIFRSLEELFLTPDTRLDCW